MTNKQKLTFLEKNIDNILINFYKEVDKTLFNNFVDSYVIVTSLANYFNACKKIAVGFFSVLSDRGGYETIHNLLCNVEIQKILKNTLNKIGCLDEFGKKYTLSTAKKFAHKKLLNNSYDWNSWININLK